ncbi:site-2 protease family protein [Streptomyces sp. NPDC008137]|uniref:site-2 protease family protein n=1 Tax=Streptomyces sp. NPDC008137 TaxID=3364813 RepID=UPI0036E09CD1
MDESGGRGQPRSGNDESAEGHAGAPAPATDPTAADEQPTDGRRFPSEQHDDAPEAGPTATPPAGPDGPEDDAGADQGSRASEGDGPSSRRLGPAGGGNSAAGRDSGATEGDRPSLRKPGPAADSATDRNAGASPSQDRGAQDPGQQPSTPDPDGRTEPAAPGTGERPLAHSADGKGPAPQRPPEPRGGLLMGRPFGVPVYVAPSWFLVAALITWVFGGQLERVLPELGAARYLVSLFFAVAFYASVLVHELAHTVAALRFKLPVRRIQLQFFGGVSEIEKEAETPGREFWLAFVGPLLSLALAGVFYAAMQTVDPGTVPGVLLAGLMISNLIVAAFNLLPGLPLDGGRMLRAVVWKITGKPMAGTVAAAWIGRALAVSVLIGLPLLTQSGALGSDAVDNVGMDTVLDALLAAILAAIIWTGAGNSLRMARLREHLPELRARALTRRAVPVETHTPLSEALRRANSAGARALVVVDADGKPLSLVREAAIVGVPEHRRPWVAVSGLAQDLTDGMRVSAELSGEELLDALRATPATEYLVVEETGEIYGVLSAADVERAFVKAMARPS